MFSSLKVIDISTVLAGPSVGTFFAELGSKVLKIEHPIHGDVTRTWKLASEKKEDQISAYFSSVNFGKEYLKLNLKNEIDHKQFLKLIETADILISNFKKGDAEKLKIMDSDLRKINPRLIHGKISGFGSDSDRVAYDLILQAESGFMSMNGTPESGPVKMPVALIDVLAAHHLKEALLLAIIDRQATNIGRTVSVSLYDAAICSLANQASNYLMEGNIAQRIGSLHPNIAPYGEIFETKDQQLITFAIGSDIHFEKLCAFLNVGELVKDFRFQSNQQRIQNRTELFQLLQEKISLIESSIILEAMHQQFVPVGKINNLKDVFDNPKSKNLIREEIIDGKATKRITSIGFKWE